MYFESSLCSLQNKINHKNWNFKACIVEVLLLFLQIKDAANFAFCENGFCRNLKTTVMK